MTVHSCPLPEGPQPLASGAEWTCPECQQVWLMDPPDPDDPMQPSELEANDDEMLARWVRKES
jgi:hypothetical protein